uniref:MARVEL domain-containing protein n=1 Tax=Steinernema glaseri TaxID=37863 RepID=A0A1I7ZC95_9BILA
MADSIDDAEPTCCFGKVRITVAAMSCAQVYIVFAINLLVFNIKGHIPHHYVEEFYFFSGVHIIFGVVLIVCVLKARPYFISYYIIFLLVCLGYSVFMLLVVISAHNNVQRFLINHNWFNSDLTPEEQESRADTILLIYSAFIIAYSVFTIAAWIILRRCSSYLLRGRPQRWCPPSQPFS